MVSRQHIRHKSISNHWFHNGKLKYHIDKILDSIWLKCLQVFQKTKYTYSLFKSVVLCNLFETNGIIGHLLDKIMNELSSVSLCNRKWKSEINVSVWHRIVLYVFKFELCEDDRKIFYGNGTVMFFISMKLRHLPNPVLKAVCSCKEEETIFKC